MTKNKQKLNKKNKKTTKRQTQCFLCLKSEKLIKFDTKKQLVAFNRIKRQSVLAGNKIEVSLNFDVDGDLKIFEPLKCF